ncbi:MAG: polysaccharide biosynthesis/export family protein [Bacteroidales bacterium]
MKRNIQVLLKSFIAAFTILFIGSCVPSSQLSYFNDINTLEQPATNPRTQKTILPFDRVYIRVLSIDPQTRQIFDLPQEARYSSEGSSLMGYLVDEAGNIEFPFVGKINVGTLTLFDAGAKIQKALSEYVPNTTVVVKFIDNQISVLGEVQRQGVFSFTQDKLTIYEAIALGGGLSRYGNRKNVILIRQEGEKIMHHRLNLSDSKIVNSDFYYVLPNDVLVVEPLKSVSTSYPNVTYQSILSTVTTFVAILVLYFNITQ